MAKLSIKVSDREAVDFQLNKNSTVIGRGSECDLVIDNSYISSVHAVIHRADDGSYIIEDRDSTHGVTVNENRIVAEKLATGDSIRLGQLEILFTDETATRAQAPPHSPAVKTPAPTLVRVRPSHSGQQSVSTQAPAREGASTQAIPMTPPPKKVWAPNTVQAGAPPAPMNAPKPPPKPNLPKELIPEVAIPTSETPAQKNSIAPGGKKITRRTATIINAPLPVSKSEEGPRASKISSIPSDLGTAFHTSQQIAEMEARLAELAEKEETSRRKYDETLDEMRTDIAELGKQRRKLREELDDLNDRHRTVSARVDDEDDAFLPIVYEVVKRVDLIDGVIKILKEEGKVAQSVIAQLETIHQSFDDMYQRHNIHQESIESGTVLNMMLRRRIKIVDEGGKEAPENDGSQRPAPPGQAKVGKTVRPGIIYSPPGGAEAILRKIEVTVEHS